MKNLLPSLMLAAIPLATVPVAHASAQGPVTLNTFTNGQVADANKVNQNFTNLKNRTDLTGANIENGSIGTDDLADAAVTSAKLADGAVTDAKLADGAVGSAKLAADSVTGTHIVDFSLTGADVSTASGDVSHVGGTFSVDKSNTYFRYWGFNPGNGVQLLAEYRGNSAGPQVRYSGVGSNFLDVGQDASGGFVIETNDAPRFTVDTPGYVRINRASAANWNVQLASDYTNSNFGFAGVFRNRRTSGTGNGAAVYGEVATTADYGVYSGGNFGASGSKSFLQPHPTDPSKQVQFVCLEGNESSTYFRGKTRLVGGRAVIAVPEDFRLVSEPTDLTVQLTPIGRGAVWVESYDLNEVRIAGDWDIEVHYFVNGVRRGFGGFETIRDNFAFRPRERGVPYGTQYPQALRQILVDCGILNADFTPNEATAQRLGWELVDPAPAVAPVPNTIAVLPRTIESVR